MTFATVWGGIDVEEPTMLADGTLIRDWLAVHLMPTALKMVMERREHFSEGEKVPLNMPSVKLVVSVAYNLADEMRKQTREQS